MNLDVNACNTKIMNKDASEPPRTAHQKSVPAVNTTSKYRNTNDVEMGDQQDDRDSVRALMAADKEMCMAIVPWVGAVIKAFEIKKPCPVEAVGSYHVSCVA